VKASKGPVLPSRACCSWCATSPVTLREQKTEERGQTALSAVADASGRRKHTLENGTCPLTMAARPLLTCR